MATDVERQALTDEIETKLEELLVLGQQALTMDAIAQLPIGDCTARLDEIVPTDVRLYVDVAFEPTP
jgi:hypothetical protein